ncbi:MAG: PD40 domain-containing protein [Bacteroidales bacterium]|nr:PD40 domain-containing protein [Bacteroidales bacterium]
MNQIFKKLSSFAAAALMVMASASVSSAQQEVRWLRNPAISPDGSQIVFGYMGNLYKVSSDGGQATAITSGDNYSGYPVWSRDGKMIAYASDIYGNFDVFVMPAGGGVPVRLTYNSTADYPYDFTPDGKYVLFGSGRFAPAESIRFPSSMFKNLYKIPAQGGRPILVTAAGADEANFNSDGTKIVFQDKKGYEDPWRKHHTSSVTRDIWVYDLKANTYTKVSTYEGENLKPVFSPDGNSVYYISEMKLSKANNALNLFKQDLNSGTKTQLTDFKDFPVREISIAKNGTISFVWKGDIYTIKDGQKARKLNIFIAGNAGYQKIRNMDIRNATEMAVSPSGKEIALINRGELFVVGVNDGRTKRITNTAYQERMITWAPDGKAIYYSAEVDGNWNIMKATLKDTTEKYFYASTLVNIDKVVADGKDNFMPDVSPDGKRLAYISERNTLIVMDLKSKKKVTVLPKGHNHSYRDGDWGFEWSPDSKWLLVDDQKNMMRGGATALISAEGGEIRYPVNSAYGERAAKFGFGGQAMTYIGQDGLKAAFFDKESYDRFMLSKDDFELLEEKEKAEKGKDKPEGKAGDKKDGKKPEPKKEVKPIVFDDFDMIETRIATIRTDGRPMNYVITKDGKKAYYLKSGEKGMELWSTDTRSRESKRVGQGSVGTMFSMELSKDEKSIFGLRNGSPVKIDVMSGMPKPVQISGKMELDAAGERAYMFDHMWLQVTKKFYDPTIHGINWKMYHDEYAKFLPYINNNYDFQVLLSELLGELNASHTGGRYYAARAMTGGDVTANFGMLFDETYTGEGIKVSAIIPGGPADKLSNKIRPGDIITAINGENIPASENYNKYLNNIANANTVVTVKSTSGNTFTQTLRPVVESSLSHLVYEWWVRRCEEMVDKLSGGKIGYVHVEGMNQQSYQVIYNRLMGKHVKKQAVVVDTRFNGGGWLHDELVTLLGAKTYMRYAPQGNLLDDGEPLGRWQKPSAVLTCEGNYSDAFMFPFVYQQNGIGKVYGMPVPGTGTAVWWETQIDPTIVFGIPMIGSMGTDGKVTENKQFEPDVRVELPYNDFLSGKDPQLEAAVKGLLQEIR